MGWFTLGKKALPTITKVKPFKKFKGQKSVSDVKFKSSLTKFKQDISNISTETVSKLGQVEQKLTGKPVTKSGWSKGKDLPPSQKSKKTKVKHYTAPKDFKW